MNRIEQCFDLEEREERDVTLEAIFSIIDWMTAKGVAAGTFPRFSAEVARIDLDARMAHISCDSFDPANDGTGPGITMANIARNAIEHVLGVWAYISDVDTNIVDLTWS